MNIDTTSKEAMQESICRLFNIDDKQLKDILVLAFSCCQKDSNHYVDGDLQREFFKEYIRNNLKQEIDEIRFFHLSRRLKGDNDNTCYSLVHLLSQSLSINNFLKEQGFTFTIENKKIIVYFQNQKIKMYDTSQSSIEGLAFKDSIKNNEYYNMLSETPNFIIKLACITGNFIMIDDYHNNSEYCCYEYALPLDKVLFDEEGDLSYNEKQHYIIESVFEKLYDYHYKRESSNDIENAILKVINQDISEKYFITKTKF